MVRAGFGAVVFCLLWLACGHEASEPSNAPKQDSIAYVLVNLDSIREVRDTEYNQRFAKDGWKLLADLCKYQDRRIFEDSEQIYGNDYVKIFEELEQVRFPITLYKQIFPNTEEYIRIDKTRVLKGQSKKEIGNKVIVEYGVKDESELKYSHLYSSHEKENYLQLILCSQGKYAPNLNLVTLSKDKLELIDEKYIYGGIYDAGDINYTISELSSDFEKLKLVKIKNDGNWGEPDTLVTNYRITPYGKIELSDQQN